MMILEKLVKFLIVKNLLYIDASKAWYSKYSLDKIFGGSFGGRNCLACLRGKLKYSFNNPLK
jgi:hypothetical protein